MIFTKIFNVKIFPYNICFGVVLAIMFSSYNLLYFFFLVILFHRIFPIKLCCYRDIYPCQSINSN